MATASATALIAGGAGVAAPKAPVDVMSGVLDYSALNSPSATKSSKFVGTGNGSSSFDMGRHPISMHSNNNMSGCGGRLQFFKEGKFILELARGDKGSWVSVPRKPFRTPSAATSATVTPTSAVTTTYPKNENSTSLSFSDDNSSIQSSPWQRDQPWKQTRPRRGISKELSLFYQRPRHHVLSQSARQAAMRKRRRPYEPTISTENHQSIFERVSTQENGDETLKPIETETKTPEVQSDEIKSEAIKEELTESKMESKAKPCSSDNKDSNVSTAKAEAALEKMNTSEDEDAMSVTVDDGAAAACDGLVNGNASEVNGDPKAHTKCETASEKDSRKTGAPTTKSTTTMTDIRLKKQKPRAKLNSIIQKLIDGVPARLEQLSKTPATGAATASTVVSTADRISSNSSGGGAIGSLSHSLAHKVSPPSSAAAASRLVEYHHHQHVSPRKRILREFEKVSLEDNNGCVNNGSGVGGGISGGAGGKRSRAKGSTATSVVAPKSMPINLAPPQAKVLATPTTSTTSVAVAAAAVATQPTRLNSSYSIHSLLGGSGSSSSKKSHDQPAAIISNVHNQHHHHHSLYASSANYPRSTLNSPKSPEMGGSNGGKSPSHAASKKQRSPPYAAAGSPLPIDYGRRTPPDSYKLAQAHAQQLQHHSFYAPYGGATVSPHIPQTGGGSGSRDLLSPPRSSSASPREPAAAAGAATTPHRTVPKKTASIRREFASPTASNSNSSSAANSCPSPGERSTSSPERRHLQLQRGSPSAVAAASGSPLHYYMYPPTQLNGSGTGSPHGIAPNATPTTSSAAVAAAAAAAAAAAYIPSVVSPSLYHPYISTLAALRHNPLWVQHYQAGASPLLPPPPPHPHSHPQTSSAAGARLSPQSPYHPFNYNGVNAAAVAVAAAAAASAFGQPTSNPHLGHPTHPGALGHHNTPPTHLAEHRTHTPKLTDICTDQMSAASSHRTTISSLPAGSSVPVTSAGTTQGGGGAGSGSTINSVQSAMFQNSSLRNELSSDLPLNLSKH
ncbi:protein hairless isoform X2 [Drosophila navojoa]|nr:protein hairless isoform X2 [Drosophila navojoa]